MQKITITFLTRIPYPFSTESQVLTTLRKKANENIVRIGENAGKQYFFLSPQCCLSVKDRNNLLSYI